MRIKSILLLFSLLLIFSGSFARKFYFSNTNGNDSYSVTQAQNSATPWKTLVNLHKFANGSTPFGTYPNKAAAGDTFLFKCGDIFDIGWGNTNDDFGVVKWWNGVAGYTAPTGTLNAPIVFTSYGSGNKPNFLFPNPTAVVARNRYVLNFKNVGYLYFDNLQFNDTRFPVNDKISSAFTCSGMMVGESNASICNNIKVTNCNFSNTSYGIVSCARIFEISNNTFTNFKSCGDTIGTFDIGADALQPSGYKYLIKNNLIQGSWAYANPNSSSQGKLGGGLETINDFDSSLIIYNTFFDNSGAMEFGQNDGIQYGPNDDTFAYNKFINNSAISYVNVTGTFACTAARLHFWNNVIIENSNSRHTGPNFGKDVLGDGQSFINWSSWPSFPLNPSDPNNFPSSNKLFGYGNDANVTADTLYDIRNNIIWNTNGFTEIKHPNTRTKIKYRNNLFRLSGGSSLGSVPLSTGEINTTSKIFTDTSNVNPMNWNLLLMPGSPAINMGMNVGLLRDYFGNQIVESPDAGIHETQMASPNPFTINVVTGTIACHGESTTATVTGSGGTLPYSGTGVFTITGGTRTFTITDATGTSKSATIVLTDPTSIVPTVTAGRIITFGGTTSITVTATGGTGAYTYKLNSGSYQTSNIFSNVTSGVDTIYVKDANGCMATSTLTISQPSAPLAASAIAVSSNLCNGATTVVSVTATGGTPPYTGIGTYTVGAGTYTYTILDSNGVSTTARITISQYAAITATVSAGTITVYGGKTTLTISNTSSGLSPYTYSLDGGIYQSSTSFSNVGAGNHNITIKDARGCSIVKSVSITQPASTLNCTSSSSGTILCYGNTVTVTVSATGGTTPYSGTGTFTVSGGSYTYTVTDAVGAIKTTSISISQPTAIVPTISAGRIIVFGGTTSITATATGGTGAYTYKLNRGAYQTSNVFSNIPASRDTIYIKDANGCIVSGIINITQPAAALAATASIATPIACNGGTAVVNVTATGGTSPYTGTGIFNVAAGTYNYSVTDSNGVTVSTSVIVTQPTILAATVAAGTISVYGATTTITATTTGGTSPYSYSLNNGIYQSANIFSNVAAGTHNINIKDAKGCIITKSITITQPASTLSCTSTASGAILCNGNAVTVSVAATGGTPPYTGTGNFNVPAGNYSYTVTDAVGSVKTTTISVTQPTAILPSISAGRIIIFGGTTSITVTATGGTGVYSYKLNRGVYQTSNLFTNVIAGTDTLYVKDANGCIASGIITITQPSAALAAIVTNTSGTICNGTNAVVTVRATGGTPPYTGTGTFSVPAGTYTYTVTDSNGVRATSSSITISQYTAITATITSGTISVYGAKTTVTVSGVSGGQTPYTYSINGGTYQTSTSFSNIGAGTHTINIQDGRGCIITKTITITQPASTLNISATPAGNISCFGGTISLTIAATGGTSPYTGTGNFIVSAGTHTYTVTDAVGSVKTTTITISQPTALVSTFTSGRILIFGGSTTITATATGGTSAYSYKLNSGIYQTSNVFSGIMASTDTIYVKDANGCVTSGNITITQPSRLVSSYTNTPIYCNGGSSSIVITTTGGIPPYTGTGTFNQSAGTVTYTIRDSAGATNSLPITLTQPAVLSQPTLTQGATITVYGNTTTIVVSGMSGGTLPYTYALDNGTYQTSSTLTSTGGNHIITIKDANGCTVNKSINIYQPVKIFIISKTDQTCAGNSNGTITVSADGGNKPYTFRISKINATSTNNAYVTDSTFISLAPNGYTMQVKDNSGNTSSSSTTINASTITCSKSSNIAKGTNETLSNSKEDVYISPNPVNSICNVFINYPMITNCEYEIVDATGIILKKGKATEISRLMIPVNDIQTGYYYLRLHIDKKIVCKKFFKH